MQKTGYIIWIINFGGIITAHSTTDVSLGFTVEHHKSSELHLKKHGWTNKWSSYLKVAKEPSNISVVAHSLNLTTAVSEFDGAPAANG